jgi:cell division protein FtsW
MKKQKDKILFFTTLFLVVFGLVMVASAGIFYSKTRFDDPYFFFKRQLFFGAIPGFLALLFFSKLNYHFWKKISVLLFIISIICLILVFIPSLGVKAYGANRWLQLGPISFQPSEMLKLSLVIYLAAWLSGKNEKVKDFLEGLVPFLIVLGIIGFLLIKQPDIGTLGSVVIIAVIMFFASGARIKHLLLLGTGGLGVLYLLIKLESYRASRLLVFLHPELDPKGVGYQINQALLAIGSGGIFGLGLGKSLQKFNYLPEPVGDSIFAIIGEELGFLGAMILIILFVIFTSRGFKIAKRAPDTFGYLMAVGIMSWIVFQSLINIAAISGMIPLTGIPLPFISYGGTSMIFLLSAVGILLNISKYSTNE